VHVHDLDESFRVKIPSHLRKLTQEVVKGCAYKQVLTTLKACDENGECRLDMLGGKSVTMWVLFVFFILTAVLILFLVRLKERWGYRTKSSLLSLLPH
jgi:hypothetical protein